MKESAIHCALVEHIKLRARDGLAWLHPPNGGARDGRTGAMLKRMGTKPGAPDFLLWRDGRAFALELKAPGGRVSESQHLFLGELERAGVYTAIAEGLDRAIAVLKAWDLIE